MLKYKMPSFLLTMRPHINEPSLLDTFLTIFFASDLFKSFTEYSYNIEKDNPLEAHFHMFFTTTLRDKEKVLNQLGVKEFKQFSAYIKNKHTDKQRCIDVQLVKKDKSRDHRLYTIGYTRKEIKHSRENMPEIYANIDSYELISALNYYLEMTKVDKIGQTKDIKVLSNKNAHAVILNYCEENKVMPTDPKLLTYFHRERMYTDFLSENQLSRIKNSCEETLLYEEYGATDEPMKTYEELMKENKRLLEQVSWLNSQVLLYKPEPPPEPPSVQCTGWIPETNPKVKRLGS